MTAKVVPPPISEAYASHLAELAEPFILQAGNAIARRFQGFVEADDVAQECRIWCWRRHDKITQWLDVDQTDKKAVKDGVNQLAKTLYRMGDRYARKMRADVLGYRIEDEWFANTGVIVELLPTIIEGGYDGFEVAPKDGHGRAKGDPAEGNGRLAMYADIKAAWDAHPSPLLERLYCTPATREQLADEWNVSLPTLRTRERAALKKLVMFLGGENPYGGEDH